MLQTKILDPNPEHIALAAASLRRGEVLAMPTETVYGLAGNAFDPAAVARIFAVKERPSFDPLIVHLQARRWTPELLQAEALIDRSAIPQHLHAALQTLMRSFWPGPLTLVLPRHARIPDLVTSGLPTVALRVPNHPVAQALLGLGFALAAPSANRFGRISPTSAADVAQELNGRIPYILDGGICAIGVESTVIGLQGEQLTLLRPGGLSPEFIEQVVGGSLLRPSVHPAEVLAPGMLQSHYAPGHRVSLFSERSKLPAIIAEYLAHKQIPGVLLLRPPEAQLLETLQHFSVPYFCLSQSGEAAEIARHLFSEMRALDQKSLSLILAELPAEGSGLIHAVRDRLLKAAGQSNTASLETI